MISESNDTGSASANDNDSFSLISNSTYSDGVYMTLTQFAVKEMISISYTDRNIIYDKLDDAYHFGIEHTLLNDL